MQVSAAVSTGGTATTILRPKKGGKDFLWSGRLRDLPVGRKDKPKSE